MIKNLLVAALLAISINTFGQELPIDPETNRIALTGIQEIEATKDELYNRTKAWGAENFNSIKNVLQVDNREGGQIIGKGIMTISIPKSVAGMAYDYPIYFTFKVDLKDGKYRYRFDDLRSNFTTISETTPAEEYLFGELPHYGGKKGMQKMEEARVYVKKELLVSLLALETSLNKGLSSVGEDW